MGNDKELKSHNTSSYAQVLSVGADSGCTVPSVLLFFDRQRYLFNVGEGFQRFCTEHHIRMSKVSSVLTTRVTTEATGGLPGMLITMADTSCGGLLSGNVGISLHGPPGLRGTVNAFRTFVNVKDMGLQVAEFDGAVPEGQKRPRPIIKNDLVTITAVVVKPDSNNNNGATNTSQQQQNGNAAAPTMPAAVVKEGGEGTEPEAKRQRTTNGIWGDGVDTVPTVSQEGPAACYICELSDIPGKFLPQKAASLGVPRGPLYGKLKNGESVVGASGLTVHPADVMEPAVPGPVVIVVDCPQEGFIGSLSSKEGLGGVLEDGGLKDKVACIIHLTPAKVVSLPAYKLWLQSFGPNVNHLMAATTTALEGGPVLRKSATLQAKLHAIDPILFPLAASSSATEGKEEVEEGLLPENTQPAGNMLKYHLRPVTKKGVDRSECSPAFDGDAVREKLKNEFPHVLEMAAKAAAASSTITNTITDTSTTKTEMPACVSAATGDEVQVTFLGTGAAIPSKYRNVTGILLDFPSQKSSMLMDCGEGSWGQIRRRFGNQHADDILKRLSLVWISHIHADHHVGLPSLLAARSRLLGAECEPVLVIGPRPLRRALYAYAKLEPMRFKFVEAAHTATGTTVNNNASGGDVAGFTTPEEVTAVINKAVKELGLSRLESIRVVHCAHSYGLLLEADNNGKPWKIVFSGDTRPCDALTEAAKDATLLIHEATFENELEEEAIAKKHSTTNDAVSTGAKSGAYRTVLTHFSQRYPKVPVIDDDFADHVGIAFDLMTLSLKDLPRLPTLVPTLKTLFEEEEALKEEGGEEEEPVPEMLS